MKAVSHNARLVRRAYWLIKLRWIAIAGTYFVIFIAENVLHVSVQSTALYCSAAALVLENIISLVLLNRLLKTRTARVFNSIRRVIHFQISVDLLILAILLHYSGGIENPFIVYFIFHMGIASILLPARESYLQAMFAVCLLCLLALLEYKEVIPHYCLEGFFTSGAHSNGLYVFGTITILASTFYLVVYMTSDISTQLYKQEEAYRQVNIQLKQKDRIKDEYVLQSCLDVVANKLVGPLNEQQADFINRANWRTYKVTHFVKTLLRLTEIRLSSNLEMDVFPLKNTINNALAAVRATAQDKSIALNFNIDSSADEVFGNQFSIEEMITNLLLNAIKYTPANGTVEINAKEDGDYVLMEVADTGIGIPPEELPKVFDEFYRATNAKKIEKDGTGLGLSIVKQIIERHSGKIWVDSKEGIGTKFSFTLPKTVDRIMALDRINCREV
ncbi:MAG: sensor histidine kinase [Planctomycetota bacterium]|jgi:signal transduction histidine kinase